MQFGLRVILAQCSCCDLGNVVNDKEISKKKNQNASPSTWDFTWVPLFLY